MALFIEPIPSTQTEEITAAVMTTFIMPPLVAIMALIAGGAVLRQPLEDGTAIYMLTRPEKRFRIGVSRALAVALIVCVATMLSGGLTVLALGELDLILQSMPGLLVGGFALGAVYGLILSLHRYAIAGVLIHAVMEATVARFPAGLRELTISWHAWGWMFDTADVARREFLILGDGGSGFIALFIGVAAIALTGLLFERRQFHLNVGES